VYLILQKMAAGESADQRLFDEPLSGASDPEVRKAAISADRALVIIGGYFGNITRD
jgi:hypothetical protein